jgi:FkbM family methyltransferase
MTIITRRLRQARKFFHLLREPTFRRGLRLGVGAAIEHRAIISTLDFATVVDIGANVGQFSLLARTLVPTCRIFAFEPLGRPAAVFRRLFAGDARTCIFQVAIGGGQGPALMHVSRRQDNSSLLPIGPLQTAFAPGTDEVAQETVTMASISTLLTIDEIRPPALLKIDVQGYEAAVLESCLPILERITYIYCEASFRELYLGQPLAHSLIAFLADKGFVLSAINNLCHDRDGLPVQADFLFRSVRS